MGSTRSRSDGFFNPAFRPSPEYRRVPISPTGSSFKTICLAACAALAISSNLAFAQVGTSVSGSVSPSGVFTYSIPIRIPPGTTGVQPSVALRYASQGGSGVAGAGWNVSGLSAITRCAANFATDGVRSTVNFDGNDKLCLDGQRLILQSGTYGQPNAIYITEIFNGSRITQVGSSPTLEWRAPSSSYSTYPSVVSYSTAVIGGSGPTSSQGSQKTTYASSANDIEFRVETKSGELMEYARADLAGGSTQPTRMWLLVRVIDSQGNYWTVDYSRDNTYREYLPVAINYTGNAITGLAPYNKVEFVYESRADLTTSYIGGLSVSNVKRLNTIRTWSSPSGSTAQQSVTEYRLSYGISPATQRSILQSVQEFGKDSAGAWIGLNPIAFGSNTPTASFSAFTGAGLWTGPGVTRDQVVVGDFNGDGKSDFAAYTGSGGIWQICESTGTGFACENWSGPAVAIPGVIAGDFNGDGKTDLVTYTGTGSGTVWQICLAGDKVFSCSTWAGPIPNLGVIAGDFNGDGLMDVAAYRGGPTWQICLSTGNNFACSYWSGPGSSAPGYIAQYVVSGDFNGDGKTDLASYTGNGGSWYYCLAGDSNFNCGFFTGPAVPRDQIVVGDFNGDGKSDFAAYIGPGDLWQICQSTSTTFVCSNWNGLVASAPSVVSGDFNGDGKTDIAAWTGTGDQWRVCMAGANNFNCYATTSIGQVASSVATGDFNGDGSTDMAGYTGANGAWDIRMAPVSSPDLLANVTTSLGLKTDITYSPLSGTDAMGRYLREYSFAYPRAVVTPPIPVVLTITADNAIGSRNAVNYWYSTAVNTYDGRGFLGFMWQRSQDSVTGIINQSWFSIDWPYIGSPTTTLTWTGDWKLLSRSDNYYGWLQLSNSGASCAGNCPGGTACMVTSVGSLSKSWDLDGTPLPQSRSSSNVDCYGNPLNITSEILTGSPWTVWDATITPGAVTGYSKTTTNEYVNDPGANWWIGRLKKSVVTSNKPAN